MRYAHNAAINVHLSFPTLITIVAVGMYVKKGGKRLYDVPVGGEQTARNNKISLLNRNTSDNYLVVLVSHCPLRPSKGRFSSGSSTFAE